MGGEGCAAKRGTLQAPYKVAIIGGGPAGIAVIVRAIRLSVIGELLGPDTDNEAAAGVLLCEAGPSAKLGSGALGHYAINSNTHANKFVNHVVNDRPDVIPPEKATGTVLEALRHTAPAGVLERAGPDVAPLGQIGAFLREVGQVVRGVLDKHPESACLCDTTVDVAEQAGVGGGFRLTLSQGGAGSPTTRDVYASKVILATGGCQRLPTWSNRSHQNKLMSSEEALSNAGVVKLRKILQEGAQTDQQAGPTTNVCIVGGSHSALSVAWLCLQLTAPASQQESSSTQLPKLDRPATSCTNSSAVSAPGRLATSASGTRSSKSAMGQRLLSPAASSLPSPLAQTCSVSILHRSPFRLFYNNKREAEADGLKDLMPTNKHGQINPFGGLRGDAKDLYLNIRNGSETRARTVQVRHGASQMIVQKAFDRAAVIVWACGYESKQFRITDGDGIDLPIRSSKGQVEVDENCRVLLGSGEFCPNLFAMGLGYGLAVTLEDGSPDGSTGRADGVAVYLKHAATVVLSSLVDPTRCFGPNTYTWTGKQELNRQRIDPIPVPCTPESQAIVMKRLCKPRSPTSSPVFSPLKNSAKLLPSKCVRTGRGRQLNSAGAGVASPMFPPTSPMRTKQGSAPQTSSPRCVSSIVPQRPLRRAWGAPVPANPPKKFIRTFSSSSDGLSAVVKTSTRRETAQMTPAKKSTGGKRNISSPTTKRQVIPPMQQIDLPPTSTMTTDVLHPPPLTSLPVQK